MKLSTPPTGDQARLLRGIAQREPEALSELFDAYSDLVYSLARRIVGDPQDAEIVVQQVFATVWEKPDDYQREGTGFATRLVLRARNLSLDLARRRNRTLLAGGEFKATSVSSAAGSGPDAPFSSVADNEKRAILCKALRETPEELKTAVFLLFYDGLSPQQIAERLSEPLATVKTRIQLGLDKLRTTLQTPLRNE